MSIKYRKRERTDYIAIHSSATPAEMQVKGEDIDKWQRERGWFSIGYHFVVRRDGGIDIGRPHDVLGAHVKGHNDNTLGICMVGGVDGNGDADNNFTWKQWESLDKLLELLRAIYPDAAQVGHRDLADTTECPSFDAKAYTGFKPGRF